MDHGVNFYASKPSSLIGLNIIRDILGKSSKSYKKREVFKKIDKGNFPILGLPSPLKVEKINELVFRN